MGNDQFLPIEVPSGVLIITDEGRSYYQKLAALSHQVAVETRLSILHEVDRRGSATTEELERVMNTTPKRRLVKREIGRLVGWNYLRRT